MVAALYVLPDGPYSNLPGVDPWTESRDARKYAGPWPVVAHPPCARWGRYWWGNPKIGHRYKLGDDGGCFESALVAVRKWGGVLEHPEGSYAWKVFGIPRPPRSGGWIACLDGGQTCCVDQGWYGHPARKMTWLYVRSNARLPALRWGPATVQGRPIRHRDGKRDSRRGMVERLTHRQRAETSGEFRDLLIALAQEAPGEA